ncbi:MAG: aspartyl protease family protein [Acidobacteriaceae bacterium]
MSFSGLSAQNFSCTLQHPSTDAAAQAFRRADYSKASELYAAAAKANAKDMAAIAGEVRSLLKQEQVDAAADLAEKSVAANPKSAELMAALGEVRFRQGRLIDALHAYQDSLRRDPCLARAYYDAYKFLWVESMYASGYRSLQTAYQLEPDDPAIQLAWIEHLPPAQRVGRIQSYLASDQETADKKKSLQADADRLKAILAAKNGGGCRLASDSITSTTLPFRYLDKDELGVYHGLGFDVKVNKKAQTSLELDTGSSGILLNRRTAARAGLVPITKDTISGIGDEKAMTGYWAYADDLRIGSLEFKNCLVEVSDKHSHLDVDGLIGADVFENYHVQLDFPLRQMTLSPLPDLPDSTGTHTTSLNANGEDGGTVESAVQSKNASSVPAAVPAIHYHNRYVSPDMRSWSPFARFGHQILITGNLKDGKPRLFLIDSGSNVTFLSVAAAKSVGKVHTDFDDRVTGLNGQVKKLYTANRVDVVFANLRAPLASVMVMNLDSLNQSNGTELSGILGLETLRFLTVDIDYRDGLIHLDYDRKHGANVYQ